MEVGVGILDGAGGFTQHIERMTITLFSIRVGAHGLDNGLTDYGLTAALNQTHKDSLAVFQLDHAPGQHQSPGRSADKQGIALSQMLFPVAGADLVINQVIHSLGVGNTQQGLSQAHEYNALLT